MDFLNLDQVVLILADAFHLWRSDSVALGIRFLNKVSLGVRCAVC